MLIIAFIIWLIAHTAHPALWAVQTWSWMCHHVVLTILIILAGL